MGPPPPRPPPPPPRPPPPPPPPVWTPAPATPPPGVQVLPTVPPITTTIAPTVEELCNALSGRSECDTDNLCTWVKQTKSCHETGGDGIDCSLFADSKSKKKGKKGKKSKKDKELCADMGCKKVLNFCCNARNGCSPGTFDCPKSKKQKECQTLAKEGMCEYKKGSKKGVRPRVKWACNHVASSRSAGISGCSKNDGKALAESLGYDTSGCGGLAFAGFYGPRGLYGLTGNYDGFENCAFFSFGDDGTFDRSDLDVSNIVRLC